MPVAEGALPLQAGAIALVAGVQRRPIGGFAVASVMTRHAQRKMFVAMTCEPQRVIPATGVTALQFGAVEPIGFDGYRTAQRAGSEMHGCGAAGDVQRAQQTGFDKGNGHTGTALGGDRHAAKQNQNAIAATAANREGFEDAVLAGCTDTRHTHQHVLHVQRRAGRIAPVDHLR